MREREWMEKTAVLLNNQTKLMNKKIKISCQENLTYAYEIRKYSNEKHLESRTRNYRTDLLVSEVLDEDTWKPRVVIEGKLNSVTTHGAIAYSEKARSHKTVHPYLRYGIFLGNRKDYPLPGRLYRHGSYFDFMLSWKAYEPTDNELDKLVKIISYEFEISKKIEEMLYSSRKKSRERYTVLHKKLDLDKI